MQVIVHDILWWSYGAVCTVMLIYGFNSYLMIGMFVLQRRRAAQRNRNVEQTFKDKLAAGKAHWPRVVTQLPIYNEMNVAERVMRAAAAMNYPEQLHEIQVLDDSDDETRDIVDRVARELTIEGYQISVIRRSNRTAYKAGALNWGLRYTEAPFVAIFDSDFVPPRDYLKRCIPHLVEQPDAGLAQARWTHLNAGESWFTRALSIGIDGHFVIEQSARAWNALYLNFNGTAGIWRRQAIDDAGGWTADTLTEDLDLSYRAQLADWRLEYLYDVEVPAELPNTFTAFKSQQFRWAKGSIETALKLLPRVMKSDASLFKKIQSVFHLTHYGIHICMALLAVLAMPLLLTQSTVPSPWLWAIIALPVILATLGPSLLYIVSQIALDSKRWWLRLMNIPGLVIVGFGISLSNGNAVLEALLGRKSAFIRTPKKGTASLTTYRLPRNALPWIEIAVGLYCVLTLVIAFATQRLGIGPFILVYIVGYLTVGLSSLLETRRA